MPEIVHFMHKNPDGWKRDAKSSLGRHIPEGGDLACIKRTAAEQQTKRWRESVDRDPADSRFTVIAPIHNEAEMLPSFLATIMASDIPAQTHAHFLLITNNCTDGGATENVIARFMALTGGDRVAANVPVEGFLEDDGLDPTCSTFTLPESNISFSHLNTRTPGKSNAMNIGNRSALDQNDDIVVTLDVNKFPHPDAIRNLVGTAYREFNDSADSPMIVTGVYRSENKGSSDNPELFPAHIPRGSLKVTGSICAWDPKKIAEIGGIPSASWEDVTLELMSIQQGKRTPVVTEASTWRYNCISYESRVEHLIRYYSGALQIVSEYPELEDVIREKVFFMNSWDKVQATLTDWAAERGTGVMDKLPFILKTWKQVMTAGQRHFMNNPKKVDWEPAA